MRAISLDYSASDMPSLAVLGMFLIACTAAILSWHYFFTLDQQALKIGTAVVQARTAAGLGKTEGHQQVKSSPAAVAAMQQARQTADFLLIPWGSVFAALEMSAVNDIALLSIEPDAKKKQLKIVVEARNEKVMFGYMERLEATPQLSDVYMLKHEILQDVAQQPLRFVLAASWKENP